MLKLKVEGGSKEGIWLVEPKVSIGRALTNNLIVNDPQVDKTHVEIWARGEELIITRNSEFPVMVNNKPLESKARLKVNDQITVGSTKLTVSDPKAERGDLSANVMPPIHTGETSPWNLVSQQTGLSRNHYELNDGTTIGRSNDCDIVILLAHLSRHHAEFKINGDNLEVHDLNSSNGTFVNGKSITHAIIHHGDEIRFDTLAFKVKGPVSEDLDKTMVRPMSVNELNSQLDQQARASSAAKAKPQSITTRNPDNKNREKIQSTNQVEFESNNLTTKLIIGATVVVGLLIVATIVVAF